jgi:hypothetical protein
MFPTGPSQTEFLSLQHVCALTSLILFSGCAAYQFGARSLVRPDIQTVHVPIVRSDSLRPDLGVRLTEAIQREIERRTPYKVTGDSTADSVLTCRVAGDTKKILTETRTDEPRALDAVISIQVSWVDRIGTVLLENQVLPPGELTIAMLESERFVPEAGQSIATSQQRAIEELASHIVDQMEFRW